MQLCVAFGRLAALGCIQLMDDAFQAGPYQQEATQDTLAGHLMRKVDNAKYCPQPAADKAAAIAALGMCRQGLIRPYSECTCSWMPW